MPLQIRRARIQSELEARPGKQLIIVHYPSYSDVPAQDWIYNDADIDHARVVWARDLGPEENQRLLRYYSNRSAWLLEPDAHPPRLQPYPR